MTALNNCVCGKFKPFNHTFCAECSNTNRLIDSFLKVPTGKKESKMSDEAKVKVGRATVNEYDEIAQRFSFHVPDAKGIQEMELIRVKVRELGMAIMDFCPPTRERATALTQLSFVMMSANSAIVQQYPIKQ